MGAWVLFGNPFWPPFQLRRSDIFLGDAAPTGLVVLCGVFLQGCRADGAAGNNCIFETMGANYLRIRSTAPETDDAGMLVESAGVKVGNR